MKKPDKEVNKLHTPNRTTRTREPGEKRKPGGGRPINLDIQGPYVELAHYVRWLIGWEGAEESGRPFINVRTVGAFSDVAPSTISTLAKGFRARPAVLRKFANGIEGADYKKLMILADHYPADPLDNIAENGALEKSTQRTMTKDDEAVGNTKEISGVSTNAEDDQTLLPQLQDDIRRINPAMSDKIQIEADRRKINPNTLVMDAISQYLETDEEREWREGFEAMGRDADTNDVDYLLPAAREVVLGK